ncbi:MAG: ADP-ribosylglycohydrolase family protein, partial [Gemmatimonadota bacterium]|nr:ADP-ribosylglycohydrolase family protein [Gemmatimonadota bacterium]
MALVAGDAMGLDARNRLPRGNGGGSAPRGPWSLQAALALASAATLSERGWDLDDLMARFWRCWDRGDETADGRVLGAGETTREAILRYGSGAAVLESGIEDEEATGPGALPRLYPVALHAAAEDLDEMHLRCRDAAALTHAHERVVECCGVYGLILRALLEDAPIGEAVERALEGARGWVSDEARQRIREAAEGESPPDPGPDEPVDSALAAALWCAVGHDDPERVVDAAVERGGRVEVVAAVAGSLIGVRVGLKGLPVGWLEALPDRRAVRRRAEAFGEVVERRLD